MRLLKFLGFLAAPAIVFYTLPALMILLVAGTLAQGSMGIYDVQRLYFSSLILWAGPIPLPGGASLLGLLSLNLTVKFLFFSEWRWRKAGIILAHLGALTLLIGGLVTALTAREGYMALAEGQVSPFVYDYHARELSVFEGEQAIRKIPFGNLTAGQPIEGLPFTLTPLQTCLNCAIAKRAETEQPFLKGEPRDLAAKMALSPQPSEKENESNLSGLTFAIEGANEGQNGTYIAFEGMPRPVEIGDYKIILGKTQRSLPFALELRDFRKKDHPGTAMAKGYESDIIVLDGPSEHDATISMNAPLRYKGYTFYQSSFEQSPEAEISVFSVVKNTGRLIPYIGTILIAAGLVLHLALTLYRHCERPTGAKQSTGHKNRPLDCFVALLLAMTVLLLSAQPAAARTLPLDDFSSLPLQHEGRIKPAESFARTLLARLSGQEQLKDLTASAWLAESLFNPGQAAEIPVFQVRGEKALLSYAALSPRIAESMEEISKLLSLPPQSLTPDQKALLALHDNFAAYGQVLRALSAVLPLNVDPPAEFKSLGPKRYTTTYLDFSPLAPEIEALVKDILARKGETLKTYTEEELRTAQLSFALDQIRAGGEGNALFAVLPDFWDRTQKDDWQTPWQSLQGGGSPEGAALLKQWQALALAYQAGDQSGWNTALSKLKASMQARPDVRPAALKAEILYLKTHPYLWAMAFYALVILLCAVPKLRPCALPAALAPLILHASAILARVYILERPPVGTLYESILFVALVAALLGWFITLRIFSKAPLALGALAALFLLAVAPFSAPDPSRLDVLGAVLNTNFWLGTHVLIITTGYGLCILCALMAHAYLWQPAERVMTLTYKTSLAALLFTCVGTILGGIWADQSWGRFWGWDPKENGALLIVLWLIWAQHGRLSGHLKERAFAAVLALLNVVVALAWFGINLLGVGLHSYGFTSGLAVGVAAFCAIQIAVIGAVWYRGARC